MFNTAFILTKKYKKVKGKQTTKSGDLSPDFMLILDIFKPLKPLTPYPPAVNLFYLFLTFLPQSGLFLIP